MSDQNQEQDNSPWAAFGGVFDEETITEEPTPGGTEQDPAPAPVETPAPEAAPAAEQVDSRTADDGVPAWTGQEEAGRSFKAMRDKYEQDLAHLRGQVEMLARVQQQPAAQPQQPAAKAEADPKPTPEQFDDDLSFIEALTDWKVRQAVAPIETKVGGQAETTADIAWERSMLRAEKAAGDAWHEVANWTNAMAAASNGFAADLARAADPGAFALKAFQAATGKSFTPAPATPPAPAAAAPLTVQDLLKDPARKAEVVQLLAAEAAAKGATPDSSPNLGPRGVGGGPGAGGVPDASLTVDAIRTERDPGKLKSLSNQAFQGFLSGPASR